MRTAEGYEVDFLARAPSGEVELIQVCAGRIRCGIGDRPARRQAMLTLTHAGLPQRTSAEVIAEPVYAWLLPSRA